jgi:hypothetical protein
MDRLSVDSRRMELRLSLRYRGPAVEAGQIDVYQAAANMVAFSEFMVASAKETYGENASAKANVSGYGRGSFVTDLVINVVGPVATIFGTLTPENFLEILKDAFKLWKFLEGEPPGSVVVADNGQYAEVLNNNGQLIQVHVNSLKIVFNEKAAEAVGQFVKNPLSTEGIDSVEIDDGKQMIGSATQKEANYFVPVRPEEKITENTIDMVLVIEAPVFKEDNKWRFSDGQNSFYADVQDREFLAKVDAGERFGKGDILVVKLLITQIRSGMKISAQRSVLKVFEHKLGQEQKPLFQ